MKPFNSLIVEDINHLYNSIYDEQITEEEEAIVEDIVSTVSLSMIFEGYSAKAIVNFFENASEDELLYRYETFDETVINESTLPEEYIEEQIEVLNEFLGALARVARGAFQAAKHAPKGQKVAAAFKGGGTAATRVGTQGTRQSSIVRKGIGDAKTKVTNALSGAGDKLKKIAPAAATTAAGTALGYGLGKSGSESDSESGSTKPTSDEPKVDSSKWGKDDPVVLARKGGVQGRLNKKTGEWEKKEWDDPEQKRYQQEKEKQAAKNEAYDIVLDYLFDNGHVDTLDEAHYVMLEMDAETIQSIVEADSIAAMRERAAKRRKQRYGSRGTDRGGRDDFRPLTPEDYERGERERKEREERAR